MTTPQPNDEPARSADQTDPQALAAIYERYAPAIYRYIYYRVGNAEQACDVQAEVFLRVVEGIERYEDRGWSISAWLYRIARDRTIDSLRRRGRHPSLPLDEEIEAADGPEEGVAALLQRSELQAALGLLNEPQRRVILLRFTYDLSLQETARQMGRTVGSVKALQHRAIERLRKIMRVDEA